MEGNLIIISAPSGAGKTTLVEKVIARMKDVRPSISYTARPPRPGEEHGSHYHFVTRAEFEAKIAHDEFLEWAEVHGNLYGTSRRHVEQLRQAGLDVVLTIDVQGAAAARRLFPEAASIFILPPSRAVLEKRLTSRGAGQTEDVALRIENARQELAEYRHFDYLVVNDELEQATEEIVAIIFSERCRRRHRADSAENLIDEFV